MDKFLVKGGEKLNGSIDIKGSKNEAYQVLCASLMTKERIVLKNVPNILDINKMLEIIKILGVTVNKLEANTYEIIAKNILESNLDNPDFIDSAKKIRGSAMLIAPLLSRINIVKIPRPGGDKIGRRPLNTHFNAFEKLGAKISFNEKENRFHIEAKKLIGANIFLDEASVTGTANIIMAACFAKGKTTIFNAACEPYLKQLCNMLNSMGAKIKGHGSNLITIEGIAQLGSTEHTIMPDIIELGSFIGLAAATKSDLLINNVPLEYVEPIFKGFKKLGISIETNHKNQNSIKVPSQQYIIEKQIDNSIVTIQDNPWPGFPPDLISIAIVAAINATGTVLIKQRMFESRLFFVDTLIEMGAQLILCDPHRVVVIGLNGNAILKGTKITSPDIRAGLALLIAALSAEGTSILENVSQIDRGYEDIENRLIQIGADIKRIKE